MMWKNNRITVNWEEYVLHKIIPSDLKDIHHIISRKLINIFKVNDPKNKIEIQRRKHVALNSFFNWAQAPHLQLKKCLEIWEPVLSEWVKQELYTILSLNVDDFYSEDLVKNKSKGKPLFWEGNSNLKNKI